MKEILKPGLNVVCCVVDVVYNTLLYSESKLEADSARVHAVALCVS